MFRLRLPVIVQRGRQWIFVKVQGDCQSCWERRMSDDRDNKHQGAKAIQEELNQKRLSRRGLLQRLRLMGVGFGAAYLLSGKDAEAVARSEGAGGDTLATLKSSNPALKEIIDEGRKESPLGEESADEDRSSHTRIAYRRFFRRFYRRVYRRF
jgi:hypothetical protein